MVHELLAATLIDEECGSVVNRRRTRKMRTVTSMGLTTRTKKGVQTKSDTISLVLGEGIYTKRLDRDAHKAIIRFRNGHDVVMYVEDGWLIVSGDSTLTVRPVNDYSIYVRPVGYVGPWVPDFATKEGYLAKLSEARRRRRRRA